MALASHVNQAVPAPRAAWAAGTTNRNGTIFASEARAEAATYTSEEMHNYGAKGVRLFIVRGAAGTTTLTVQIQVKDPATGTWVNLAGAVTAALTGAAANNILTLYPGIAATANVDVSNHLGPVWRITATLSDGDTTPVTFSVGADYLF